MDLDGGGVFDFVQHTRHGIADATIAVRNGRTSEERVISATTPNYAIITGGVDYSGDGLPDLIQRLSNVNQVLNPIDGSLGEPVVIGDVGDRSATGNFGGDPRGDMALALNGPNAMLQWTVQITGGASATVSLVERPAVPLSGDFDGDGYDDRAAWSTAFGVGTFVYRNAAGQLATPLNWGAVGDLVPAGARVH